MTEKPPVQHHRRSIRLNGYDYSLAGAYFITICVEGGACLLGTVVEDIVRENSAGMMVKSCWLAQSERFASISIDYTIVMPNHIHGIVFLSGLDGAVEGTFADAAADAISDDKRAATRAAPTLGDVAGAFKSITTNEYIRGVLDEGWPSFEGRLWQRNYWERIIRNERGLNAIRNYIYLNPANWKKDKVYTGN
jgi:putative transposase